MRILFKKKIIYYYYYFFYQNGCFMGSYSFIVHMQITGGKNEKKRHDTRGRLFTITQQ